MPAEGQREYILYLSAGISSSFLRSQLYTHSPFMKKLLFCLAICLTAELSAQRPDNYKPDNRSVKLESTNLPIVFINVNNKQIDREERITGEMVIIYNGGDQLNFRDTVAHKNQTIDYRGPIGLKYRGNSSFTNSDKKPYAIRTQTPAGKKKNVSILGMGSDNDWALLAPYSDRSMLRDVLIMELSRPYFEFVPSGRFCELILDGTYYGVFIMSERVRVGDHRLNIGEPGDEGDALTGGYHMELDRQDEAVYVSQYPPLFGNGSVAYGREIAFQYKSPEDGDLTPAQRTYIHGRIHEMEKVLKSSAYADPLTGYRKYLDEISFIDYMIATELARNVDGYRLSTNLYKYRDSRDPRFKMSLWDFNIAFGNADYAEGWTTNTWAYNFNDVYRDDNNMVPFWWKRLLQDKEFVKQLKERWSMCRTTTHSNTAILNCVDSLDNLLNVHGAQQRNSQAWPRWNRKVWPNYYLSTSYEDEINYLKNWISDRLVYLDNAWFNITGMKEVVSSESLISVDGGSILCSRLSPGARVEVYRTDGTLLFLGQEYPECRVKITDPGIYLVKLKDRGATSVHKLIIP